MSGYVEGCSAGLKWGSRNGTSYDVDLMQKYNQRVTRATGRKGYGTSNYRRKTVTAGFRFVVKMNGGGQHRRVSVYG